MGLLEGKVAFITGAARGQGRSHAVALAKEGADIIAVDVCADPTTGATLDYPAATEDDLAETERLVKAAGGNIVTSIADVRDQGALDDAVARGRQEFGGLHVVVANAAIASWSRFWEMPETKWQDTIDINLSGVWKTIKAAVPSMIDQGAGGSIILVSSVAGLKGLPAHAHYAAAKHGVVGLAKVAAIELGPFQIRVNTIHPWGVNTPMAAAPTPWEFISANPSYANSFGSILPDPMVSQPEDISNAVVWLASDLSRCVTGIQLPVDMGATSV